MFPCENSYIASTASYVSLEVHVEARYPERHCDGLSEKYPLGSLEQMVPSWLCYLGDDGTLKMCSLARIITTWSVGFECYGLHVVENTISQFLILSTHCHVFPAIMHPPSGNITQNKLFFLQVFSHHVCLFDHTTEV